MLGLKALTEEEKVRRAGLTLVLETCLVICYSKGAVSKCLFGEVRMEMHASGEGSQKQRCYPPLSVSCSSFVHWGSLAIHRGGPRDLAL